MTKLVMTHSLDTEAEADAAPFTLPDAEGLTPQQELRALKIKHGGWSLAPNLVTEESMWQKTLMFEIPRTLWGMYAAMSKDVQKPKDVLKFTIHMSRGGWLEELSSVMVSGFLDTETLRKVYFADNSTTSEHLSQHFKFVITLLNKRAMSLAAFYRSPPYRYAGLASPEFETEVRALMDGEWKTILEAEELAAHGKHVPPLDAAPVLGTAFARLFYLANEVDALENLVGEQANGVWLARAACEHLGDTVVIENTHQKTKDLLRSARHQVTSRLGKFHSVITSNVLKGRGVNFLQVDDARKAAATVSKGGILKVVKTTHPNNHKMQKKFQEVMKYKASRPGFSWPSSSHETLFNEAACLELLVSDGCLDLIRTGGIAAASVTCLVGSPGSVLANCVHGTVFMVIAVGTLNFLAWEAWAWETCEFCVSQMKPTLGKLLRL